MRLASLDCVRIYTVSVRCRFCVRVFYHVGRVLSAVAKFHVYLVGEGEGLAEMGKGRGKGQEWGKKGKGRKWECTKYSPQMQQIWHLETPLGATAPCHKLFTGTTFASLIV